MPWGSGKDAARGPRPPWKVVAVAAALALAACQGATSHGFDVEVPAGWEDRTDEAETKFSGEFEAVYEGPAKATLSIARDELPRDSSLSEEVERARLAAEERLGRKPSPARATTLGGEPALLFDFAAEDRRGREISAVRGGWLYVITLNSPWAALTRNLAALETLVGSWRWEE